jgi:hypothetical protein
LQSCHQDNTPVKNENDEQILDQFIEKTWSGWTDIEKTILAESVASFNLRHMNQDWAVIYDSYVSMGGRRLQHRIRKYYESSKSEIDQIIASFSPEKAH